MVFFFFCHFNSLYSYFVISLLFLKLGLGLEEAFVMGLVDVVG